MKNIKYLVAFLAAALLLSACEKGDGLSQQNKDKERPYVTISQKVADDVTLTFDLTASEDAAHYAYAVFKGSDNEAPAAYDILVGETLGEDGGSFSVVDGEDKVYTTTVTVDCSGFPSETYQIFAAAITDTGLLSNVVALDVTMNDTLIPQPAGAQTDGNSITLAFDEIVRRGTGKATVSVIAWGIGQYYIKNQLIEEEYITVEANTVTIVCPEAGAGAGYILSFEEGLVTDLAGNPCEACMSGLDQNGDYINLGWDTEWVNFNISENSFETPAEDTDWAAEDASLTFKLPVEVFETGLANPVQVMYTEDEGSYQLNAEYVLAEDARTVTVYLPKMPTGTFDVYVAQGAFSDMWGNINNEFNPQKHRYTNYLTAVVGGNYLVDYLYADEEGNPVLGQFPLNVELADRTTAVIAADWFNYVSTVYGMSGYIADPVLVGTVNYAQKTITFNGDLIMEGKIYSGAFGSGFYYYDEAQTSMVVFWGGGETGNDPVVLTFNDEGYIETMSYCDYTVHDATSGKGLFLFGCTAVTADADAKVTYVPTEEDDSAEAAAPSNAKLNSAYVKGNFWK